MRTILLLLSVFLLIGILGCSKGGDILLPDLSSNSDMSSSHYPVGVSDYLYNGLPSAGMGALGIFNVEVDPQNLKAEIVSLRSPLLTDVLEVVDITNFLTLAPCTDCIKMRSIALDLDGNVILSIGIKHPFDAGDPLKPITGRNRADLHIFNIEGIVVSNSTSTPFPGLNENVADFKLLNVDGFTGYLDDVLDEIFPTESTIHPYILHFDDYTSGNFDPSYPMGFESVTDPPPSGNLVMAMGCDYDYKDYVFAPLTGRFDFIFAVGCTYAVSAASKNQRFTPEYRIPQHNKKAASEVSVEVLSNSLEGGNTSSTADVEVRVVDISHGVAVGEALNEMLSDSSVSEISIDIPGVMSDVFVIDGSSPIWGTGHDPSDPLIYQATLINTAGAGEGTYQGLVKVVDSYAPGQNQSPLLNGMDGIKRVGPIENPLTGLFEITEFATFQVFEISVTQANTPPNAVLTSNPDPATIVEGNFIILDASGSTDLEDDLAAIPLIFEFMWDYDLNPSNFLPDYGPSNDSIVQTPPYMTAGNYHAAVRVTDSGGLWDIASIDIQVLIKPELVVYRTFSAMYTCRPDFTNRQSLGRSGYYPCISQYNNVIVYCDSSSGNLRAINVDGTNDRLVVSGAYRFPTVSADGTIVAFYDNQSPSHCFRVNIDGSNLLQISPSDTVNWRYAGVSGDGSKIVMERYSSPYSIYICNSDGSNLTMIKSDAGYPSITFDAQWVFYETPFQVRRIRTDGTQDQLVIGCSATSYYGISPDGTKVTYCQYYSGTGNDLGFYDLVTSQERRLTFVNRNAGQKTLSIDGAWAIADGFATGGMYSIKTDGTGSIIEWGQGDDPSAHGAIGEHY